jgi:hypothetical protein
MTLPVHNFRDIFPPGAPALTSIRALDLVAVPIMPEVEAIWAMAVGQALF